MVAGVPGVPWWLAGVLSLLAGLAVAGFVHWRSRRRIRALSDALAAAEKRFQGVFEAFPHPISLTDRATGRYVDLNEAAEIWAGTPRGNIIGSQAQDFGVDEPEQDAQIRASGRIDNAVMHTVGPLTGDRWVMYSSRPVELDGRSLVLSVGVDITQLKQVEERLRRSEASFTALFESAPLPMAFNSSADAFLGTRWNHAWFRHFGYSREVAADRGGDAFALWVDAAQRNAYIEQVRVQGHVSAYNARLRHADGEVRDYELSGEIFEASGQRLLMTVYIDVTDARLARATLQESEARLQAVFNAVPTAMIVIDADAGFQALDANGAWYRQFLRTPEQTLGRNGVEMGLWAVPEQRRHCLDTLERLGVVAGEEFENVRGDGSRVLVRIRAQRFRAGARNLVVMVQEDISQERRSEQTVRRFGMMVEHANDAIMLVEDDRFIECNEAALRMFGSTRKAFIGSTPMDHSPVRQPDGRESAEAIAQSIAPVGGTQRFDWVFLRQDGTPFDTEVALSGFSDAGRARVIAIVRDVSAGRQAQRALLASEQRFRQLFDQAPVALTLSDRGGRLLSVNLQWMHVVGYSAEEMRDMESWWSLVLPDPAVRERARAAWHAMLISAREQDARLGAGTVIEPGEFVLTCKDGQTRTLSLGGVFVADGFVGSAHDITELKRIEAELQDLNTSLETRVAERTHALAQAKLRSEATNLELQNALANLHRAQDELVRSEKLASLGALVAGVAHELNTPIGNAVMVSSTLADHQRRFAAAMAGGLRRSALEAFVANTREATQVLERNLYRASELIGSFKQIAVDQSSYMRRGFDLAELVQEISLALSPTLRRAGVVLVIDVPPGIRMDSFPGPLGQVLMNLVNNAVQHAFDGLAAGTVRVRALSLVADRICLVVADDGQGIAPQYLKRIFDPFFTTRLGHGGSGLGLHICYTLVTGLLGGRIDVSSRPGEGAEFRVDLPLVAPASTDPVAGTAR